MLRLQNHELSKTFSWKKKRGLIWSFRTFLESALYAHQFHGFAKGGEWTISVRNNDTSREIIVHLTIFDRVSNVFSILLRYLLMYQLAK